MDFNLEKFLASPLKDLIQELEENKIDYILTEIKPPLFKKNDLNNKDKKRVLNIKDKKDTIEVIWSFQYNS